MSMSKYIADTDEIDKLMCLEHLSERNTNNLMFMTVALAGEAGEFANVVKKAVRNGVTEERIAQMGEELVDIVIYLCMLLKITGIDFDKAWDEKHQTLKYRSDRLLKYNVENTEF